MVEPFVIKPLKKPSLIQGWMNKLPKENAIIELNNLLASTNKISDLSSDDIKNISDKYQLDIIKTFNSDREILYRTYLWYTLTDRQVTEDESKELLSLQKLLTVDDRITSDVYRSFITLIIKNCVDDILKDGKVDRSETEYLEQVIKNLNIPQDIVEEIYGTRAKAILQTKFNDMMRDRKFSPEENKELHELSYNLGVSMIHDKDTLKILQNYRLNWQAVSGNVPAWNVINDRVREETIANLNWITSEQKSSLNQSLKDAYANGESAAKIRNRVMNVIGLDKDTAANISQMLHREILYETYLLHYRSMGIQAIYIKDSKSCTCTICKTLSGSIWPVYHPELPMPPHAEGCRCTIDAWTKEVPKFGSIDKELYEQYKKYRDSMYLDPR